MSEECSAPTLPTEVEQQIFELSALSRPVSVPNLMRVAWRIKQWVEPILYRTLVINCEPIDGLPACTLGTFKFILNTKSPSFLRDSVRNVIVEDHWSGVADEVFSKLTGLTNLYILRGEDLHQDWISQLTALPLRQFYGDMYGLHTLKTPADKLFPCLTHLELFNGLGDTVDTRENTVLAHLPRLTHLAFYLETVPLACTYLLEACKLLCALIIICSPPTSLPTNIDILANDPRFVMMQLLNYTDDWQYGALSGSDYWSRADEFIAKRMAGKIPRTTFFLEGDRSIGRRY
ncbi:hypothetical protein C8R43DRAFT_1240298 [Mycena crocata]|nr:hypothetical protein C8R43DRAFT_1240298 [Mycena crocata]